MASKRDIARDVGEELAAKWEREAFGYERQAGTAEFSSLEKRLLQMHARVKRGCAQELRIESRKISRG